MNELCQDMMNTFRSNGSYGFSNDEYNVGRCSNTLDQTFKMCLLPIDNDRAGRCLNTIDSDILSDKLLDNVKMIEQTVIYQSDYFPNSNALWVYSKTLNITNLEKAIINILLYQYLGKSLKHTSYFSEDPLWALNPKGKIDYLFQDGYKQGLGPRYCAGSDCVYEKNIYVNGKQFRQGYTENSSELLFNAPANIMVYFNITMDISMEQYPHGNYILFTTENKCYVYAKISPYTPLYIGHFPNLLTVRDIPLEKMLIIIEDDTSTVIDYTGNTVEILADFLQIPDDGFESNPPIPYQFYWNYYFMTYEHPVKTTSGRKNVLYPDPFRRDQVSSDITTYFYNSPHNRCRVGYTFADTGSTVANTYMEFLSTVDSYIFNSYKAMLENDVYIYDDGNITIPELEWESNTFISHIDTGKYVVKPANDTGGFWLSKNGLWLFTHDPEAKKYTMTINSANSNLFKEFCKGNETDQECKIAYEKYCEFINNDREFTNYVDEGCTCIKNQNIIDSLFPGFPPTIQAKALREAPCIYKPCVVNRLENNATYIASVDTCPDTTAICAVIIDNQGQVDTNNITQQCGGGGGGFDLGCENTPCDDGKICVDNVCRVECVDDNDCTYENKCVNGVCVSEPDREDDKNNTTVIIVSVGITIVVLMFIGMFMIYNQGKKSKK